MPAKKNKNITAAIFCAAVLASLATVLFAPPARSVFIAATTAAPLTMGFIKFALLATSGEIIAGRIVSGRWEFMDNFIAKAAIWGVIGAVLAFLIKVYAVGTVAAITGNGPFVTALATSVIMNATFAPVMMGLHKMTDTWLALAPQHRSIAQTVAAVDWESFVSFTLLKTIPFFWIPAHTITFLLPGEYRMAMAAMLSIALGIILSLKKR